MEWHFLEQHPDDLPEIDAPVLCCFGNDSYRVCTLLRQSIWEDDYGYLEQDTPICWAYIPSPKFKMN